MDPDPESGHSEGQICGTRLKADRPTHIRTYTSG